MAQRRKREDEGDELERLYPVRDMLLFPEQQISPYETTTIKVMAETESLVQRIIMHRSIATKLNLIQIFVGDVPRTRAGAGSCEIFLSDVPNWSPNRMVLDKEHPLRLVVRNMVDMPLRVAGNVIVGVKDLPTIVEARRRVFPLGGVLGGGREE